MPQVQSWSHLVCPKTTQLLEHWCVAHLTSSHQRYCMQVAGLCFASDFNIHVTGNWYLPGMPTSCLLGIAHEWHDSLLNFIYFLSIRDNLSVGHFSCLCTPFLVVVNWFKHVMLSQYRNSWWSLCFADYNNPELQDHGRKQVCHFDVWQRNHTHVTVA